MIISQWKSKSAEFCHKGSTFLGEKYCTFKVYSETFVVPIIIIHCNLDQDNFAPVPKKDASFFSVGVFLIFSKCWIPVFFFLRGVPVEV